LFQRARLASAELVRRVAFLIEIIMRVPQKQKYRRQIELADARVDVARAGILYNEPMHQQQHCHIASISAFGLLL
jgi:hypothetical protein